jgi:hypothetical protein
MVDQKWYPIISRKARSFPVCVFRRRLLGLLGSSQGCGAASHTAIFFCGQGLSKLELGDEGKTFHESPRYDPFAWENQFDHPQY